MPVNSKKTKIAYFDQAATSFPKPKEVYDFMDEYYRNFGGGSVGRGGYSGARSAGKLVQETRELLKDLLHCPAYDAVFTSSATEALNVILQGYNWNKGMVVYLSPFEHNSVLRVMHHLCDIYDLDIRYLTVDRAALKYDLIDISNTFKKNHPDAVIINHASNVCGLVSPVKDIFKLSKKYGAFTLLDMSQTAGLVDIDVVESLVDAAVFAGHKTLLGPFGVAGFVKRRELKFNPLLYGGTGSDSANLDMPSESVERYEAGSRNILAIAGLNASLKWIKNIGTDNIITQEIKNRDRLLHILRQYDNINIIEIEDQLGVISVTFDGYASEDIGKVLSEQNVSVRCGLQCSPLAHKFLGTFPSGTVRFSIGYFTSASDFQILDDALRYIYENS